MPSSIDLNFKKAPTFFTIASAAINSRSVSFDPQKPLFPINARRDGIIPNPIRLHQFARICGIETNDKFPLVYPLTFIYPMVQVMLARREMPLLLSKMLNTRTKIVQHRNIDVNESFDAFCKLAGYRLVEKGVEIDVYCTVKIAGEIVWECTITFYYRGLFKTPDSVFVSPAMETIPDAPEIARWYLPSGNGIAFARLSGDFNPLHYWTWYAKLSGFKRSFAQPLLVLAETLSRLEKRHPAGTFRLDIAFKGPVYYKSNVILKSVKSGHSERFDIYCEDNPRPCICGNLHFGEHIL